MELNFLQEMDNSGNSGSLQSSSGGDEEYESRAAASSSSISAFMTNHQPPQQPFFDPFSNYNLHFLNTNTAWPGTSPRTNPNPTLISHDSLTLPSFQQQSTAAGPAVLATLKNSNEAPLLQDQNRNQAAAVRNPKKRSRASRRAPTTVLTTDTTNFRAMVQEFTGIPASPFNSSPFPRAKLDLFGGLGSGSTPPPYLRRPFAQKVQPHLPFLGTNNHYNTTSSNQLQFPVHVHDHHSNGLNNNNQNPLLASLLQTNPKFPFSGSSITGSKPDDQSHFRIGLNDGSYNKMARFNESSLGNQDNVSATTSGLQTLISANQMNRADGNGSDNDDHRANAEAGNGGYNNFKGPEKVPAATRVEGMVESWICSSE